MGYAKVEGPIMKPPKFLPGALVLLAEGDIKANVTVAKLYPDGSWTYSVSWWNDGQCINQSFDECEITEREGP